MYREALIWGMSVKGDWTGVLMLKETDLGLEEVFKGRSNLRMGC